MPLERQVICQRLESEQNCRLGLAAAISAMFPAGTLFTILALAGGPFEFLLWLPALLIGYAARWGGRCIDSSSRMVIAFAAVLFHLLASKLLAVSEFVYLLLPVVAVSVYLLSKRQLTDDEQNALSAQPNPNYSSETSAQP